jgi:predicted RNA-binding Zn-ribbon protein involved in translation (DUF1610 family)
LHLFKARKVTAKETEKLHKLLTKHGIPEKATQRLIKIYKEERRMPKNYYTCPSCGYVLPKKEAKVSGWNSQSSLRHIHCPKCGKTITHTP